MRITGPGSAGQGEPRTLIMIVMAVTKSPCPESVTQSQHTVRADQEGWGMTRSRGVGGFCEKETNI